jgi:hypothetical protein
MAGSEIALANVPYQDINQTKFRPILILDESDEEVCALRITTKYHDKSYIFRSHYFEIVDWNTAGLYYPSWIDTSYKVNLSKSNSIYSIGSLSEYDLGRFSEFLKNMKPPMLVHDR